MPSWLPSRTRTGQGSYGTPLVPTQGGGPSFNRGGAGIGTPGQVRPFLGPNALTLGYPTGGMRAPVRSPGILESGRVARGGRYRYQSPGPVGAGIGVQATIPASEALGALPQSAVVLPGGIYGTTGPNVVSPLFGRPGFNYAYWKPQTRLGTALKGAPGSGRTGGHANRSLGFQSAAYATEQYIDLNQYDYTPTTNPYYGIKNENNGSSIPRSINVADDGIELLGTYRAHDSTPADRFFKQGRSAAMWEDMTYGPQYRWLLPYQQVARYNIYTELALSRMLPPNAYFLGYQTQPAVAAQLMNSGGQGAPIGYGAH